MDHAELLAKCLDFRAKSLAHTKQPLQKKANIDLLAKFCFLMLNSVGRPTSAPCIFIDEVKNPSMVANLRATIAHCPEDFVVMNLRGHEKDRKHARVGYLLPMKLMIRALLLHSILYLGIPFLGWKGLEQQSFNVLIHCFQKYLSQFSNIKPKIYAMTDHHFYSMIACVDDTFDSYVIQHGLLNAPQGKRSELWAYLPIYADYFLAWGKRTQELLEPCGGQIIVTGTFKFESIQPSSPEEEGGRSILYCVSILDEKLVMKKIDVLRDIAKNDGWKIKVKVHPGSLFSMELYKKRYADTNIAFYKECSICDIDFTLAVIENSTVLLDILYLAKPFIIYDETIGYFSKYADIIPITDNADQLVQLIARYKDVSLEGIMGVIKERELNDGKCEIFV